jgi:hypothetical protein
MPGGGYDADGFGRAARPEQWFAPGRGVKDAIERALHPLLGLPLWAVGRAGSLAWFQFGQARSVPAFRGGPKKVGEYALHLDCPWRLIEPTGLVVATDASEPDLLAQVGSPPLFCAVVSGASDGGVSIRFVGGWLLVIEPAGPDHLEYWRLFQPGMEGPHVVVGPAGVE